MCQVHHPINRQLPLQSHHPILHIPNGFVSVIIKLAPDNYVLPLTLYTEFMHTYWQRMSVVLVGISTPTSLSLSLSLSLSQGLSFSTLSLPPPPPPTAICRYQSVTSPRLPLYQISSYLSLHSIQFTSVSQHTATHTYLPLLNHGSSIDYRNLINQLHCDPAIPASLATYMQTHHLMILDMIMWCPVWHNINCTIILYAYMYVTVYSHVIEGFLTWPGLAWPCW